jgi:hypothetical protein
MFIDQQVDEEKKGPSHHIMRKTNLKWRVPQYFAFHRKGEILLKGTESLNASDDPPFLYGLITFIWSSMTQ